MRVWNLFGALRHRVETRLNRRLILVLVTVLASVSTAFLAMVLWIYQSRLIEQHARASLEVNQLLQASLENAMLKRDINGLRAIVDRLGTQDGIAQVMIVNPDREIRFSSRAGLIGTVQNDVLIDKALAALEPVTAFVSGGEGGEWLRSVNPVRNKPPCKECHGAAEDHPVNGLLVVDYKAAGIRGDALRSAGLLGASGAVVILFSGLCLWLAFDRMVLRRLKILQVASSRLAEGELEARAEIAGKDEISQCASTFNQMVGRLQTTIDQVALAENVMQAVIDAIPDGVRVIGEDFTILKANAAYRRQVGQNGSQAIGSKCYASSHDRKEPCPETLVTCPVKRLRSDPGALVKFSDAHRAGDGSQLFVEVSAARVELPSKRGTSIAVVESIRDLSQAVELSQKHRLSEIGLLATGVAHEIHNPLSSIELALSAIRDSMISTGAAPDQQHYIDIARTEIAKCMSVTDGLMRLSEPPRGAELVEIDRIVTEILELLQYQLESDGIEVDLDIVPPLRVTVADSDIRMIIINLAQNAIHAMTGGGRLRIEGRLEKRNVVLHFADTGIGIPHEFYDKIFLPFWTRRADGSVGRGLGLSICKAIVERYGGTISFRSAVGIGTEFVVTLPSADTFEADPA